MIKVGTRIKCNCGCGELGVITHIIDRDYSQLHAELDNGDKCHYTIDDEFYTVVSAPVSLPEELFVI